jgi:F-type H+-transporting ATPase subunit a
MIGSPLQEHVLAHVGPVPITETVVTTWVIMALLVLGAVLTSRSFSLRSPGKIQALLELFVVTLDSQIRDTMQDEPTSYRTLVGGLFAFILVANWSSLVPGVQPPTAHIETDAALASIVFAAMIWHGVRTRGALGYLKSFAEPAWFLAPLTVVEQMTRTFSMVVRLFGHVMSGVFIIGILLSLAGLLVPIPLMALDLLTGAVQAYIFAVLAMVFVGAAISNPTIRTSPGESA